jgi:hypothetical protein
LLLQEAVMMLAINALIKLIEEILYPTLPRERDW